MQFIMNPIGIIHTPFKTLDGMPIQPSGAKDTAGTIIIDPAYETGLQDLDGFSHIILIYAFHRSKGYDLVVKPFLDTEKRGLFSTRAPRRPNPIGLSIVRLTGVRENRLFVQDIDVLDGTPLLDMKPYVPNFDARKTTSVGWLGINQKKATTLKSDRRFMDNETPNGNE